MLPAKCFFYHRPQLLSACCHPDALLGAGWLLGCQAPSKTLFQQQDLLARLQLQLAPAEVGTGLLPYLRGLSCSPVSGQGAQCSGTPWLGVPSIPPAGISLLPGEGRLRFSP